MKRYTTRNESGKPVFVPYTESDSDFYSTIAEVLCKYEEREEILNSLMENKDAFQDAKHLSLFAESLHKESKWTIDRYMILKGIENHTIKFIIDPNLEHGTVASIGSYWFYFGGITAEDENPVDYIEHVSREDIVDSIYEVLNDMKVEFPDEYQYYFHCLTESM